MNRKTPSAVIVVSSHVARGGVGNRAAVFALETLGHEVWAVPTVVLPWHPGHGPGTRIVAEPDQFAALLSDLAAAPWLDEVGGVLSGYLGDAAQAEPIAELARAVKARNPDAIYLCDPVLGDAGSLYVPQATAMAIRDRLLPLADIATPNLFELQWLSGRAAEDRDGIVEAARAMAPETIVVTSAPGTGDGRIGNLLVRGGETLLAEHERLSHPPKGAGDLFAALFLAGSIGSRDRAVALERATQGVRDVLAGAVARGADELMLAADAECLRRPSEGPPIRRTAADEATSAR